MISIKKSLKVCIWPEILFVMSRIKVHYVRANHIYYESTNWKQILMLFDSQHKKTLNRKSRVTEDKIYHASPIKKEVPEKQFFTNLLKNRRNRKRISSRVTEHLRKHKRSKIKVTSSQTRVDTHRDSPVLLRGIEADKRCIGRWLALTGGAYENSNLSDVLMYKLQRSGFYSTSMIQQSEKASKVVSQFCSSIAKLSVFKLFMNIQLLNLKGSEQSE